MKVLVVDDHPPDVKLMGLVLRADGHSVEALQSAEGAAEAIKAALPDVVLLDMRLPGMDGPSLIRYLRAADETRHIPLIAVTAFPHQYQRDQVLEAGCDAYIVKPINTREFSNRLQDVVDRKSRGDLAP